MKKWQKIQLISEYIVDGLGTLFSLLLAYFLFGIVLDKVLPYSLNSWMQYVFILFISYSTVSLGFSNPINLEKRNRVMEFISVLRNCALTYMLFAVLLLLFKNPIIDSRYLFIGSFVCNVLVSCPNRYILKRVLTNNFSNSKSATLVGVITTPERAETFLNDLKQDWTKHIKGITLVEAKIPAYAAAGNPEYISCTEMANSQIHDVPVIPDLDSFLGWARLVSVDEVFINISTSPSKDLDDLIEELEDMGITVHINIPSLEEFVEKSKFSNVRCNIIAGYPMASFAASVQNQRGLAVKRIMDVVGSLVGLILSTPIILLIAIPLCIESPGPLFFKQQRIGKNGRIFNMYKLRSMYTDAEERKKEFEKNNTMSGFMFKMDNDPRITKVGKFIRKYSIDELPQFYNVLKGDMSLVGTRPPTIDEFEQYSSHHKRRLSMRPGITGMWQVSGRSDIHDFEDVVRLDCEYIDNWSVGLDIKILLKTVSVVFTGSGAK